jgi:hypothetical protein
MKAGSKGERYMKKIAIVVAALIMFAALFTGCADNRPDSEKIIGTWTGEMDMTKMMNDSFGTMLGRDFKVDSFKFSMSMTFRKDGTCVQEVDKESVQDAFERIKTPLKEALQELASVIGRNVDELLDSMFSVDEMADNFNNTVKYKIEDGKLYFSNTGEDEINSETYTTYKFEDGKLILTGVEGADASYNRYLNMFPMTFVRKK